MAAFETTGVLGLPMHLGFFLCTRMAIQLKIPLVIWGENSQLEYGGEDEEQFQQILMIIGFHITDVWKEKERKIGLVLMD